MAHSLVGTPIEDLDTPAMLVDLDAMDRNIAHIAAAAKSAGVNWRPHAKGHKSPAVAHRQIAAGAIGVTVAKVGEAEVFATNGVRDILIANQVIGPIKTRRLAALIAATGADIAVAVDQADNIRELDAAAAEFGVKPRVIVEIDTGMSRSGAAPGEETVALSRQIASSPHLRFAGVMSWEGHAVSIPEHDLRHEVIDKAITALVGTAEACKTAGLPCEIVSCGGSGTYVNTLKYPGITEIQAGGATMGDYFYIELESPTEAALTLMAQVTSRPTKNRIILDCGRKTIDPTTRPPRPRGIEGVEKIGFSAEHCTIQLDHAQDAPRPGDRVYFDIGYHDQALHLHEELFAVRNGKVVAVWPTLSRGKIR